MADELAELDEFEEVEKVGLPTNTTGSSIEGRGNEPQQPQQKGNKPDFRVLQPDTDANGKQILRSVGAMWKTTTRDGREFFVMKIGELRLLVWPNNK